MRWIATVPIIGTTYTGLPPVWLFMLTCALTFVTVSVMLRTDHPLRSLRDRRGRTLRLRG